MATVKSILEGTEIRSEEVRAILTALKQDKTVNGTELKSSTVSTTRHHVTRDSRVLALVAELSLALEKNGVHEVKLSDKALQGFNQLCFPESGSSKVVVKEGDSILDLMEKYSETKDLLVKLNKAAEKVGCRLNFTTGIVVKK